MSATTNNSSIPPTDIFEQIPENDRFWLKTGFIIIGIVTELLALMLCTSIVLYERFGGDPQKRTILNQLMSYLCSLMIFLTLLPLNVFIFRIAYGPIPELVAKLTYFMPKACVGFAALFTLNEMILLRYTSVFVWKKVPPLNENIFSLIFFVGNLLLAVILTVYGNMGHNIEQGLNLLMCGVYDENHDRTPVFRFVCMNSIVFPCPMK